MSTRPLLPAGAPDLEGAEATGPEAGGFEGATVYAGVVLETLVQRVRSAARRWELAWRPGYAESLRGRRGLRRLLLPVVGLVSLAADHARPGGPVAGALAADGWVLLALLGAAAATHCSGADLAAAAAAVLHTWRGSERAAAAGAGDGGAAVAVEYLVMFWLVALPLLAGTDWGALAAYCAAILSLWLRSALPEATAGVLIALPLLAAPLVAAEFRAASLCSELARRKGTVEQLIAGFGGTTCSVDVGTGVVVEASPELERALQPPGAQGTRLEELVELPGDRDCLRQLSRTESLAEGWAPVAVASLRLAAAPRGVAAQLLPLAGPPSDRSLRLLVDVRGARLRAREQAVLAREERLAARERAAASRESHARELEAALAELHGLYQEGCRELESEGRRSRPPPEGTRVDVPTPAVGTAAEAPAAETLAAEMPAAETLAAAEAPEGAAEETPPAPCRAPAAGEEPSAPRAGPRPRRRSRAPKAAALQRASELLRALAPSPSGGGGRRARGAPPPALLQALAAEWNASPSRPRPPKGRGGSTPAGRARKALAGLSPLPGAAAAGDGGLLPASPCPLGSLASDLSKGLADGQAFVMPSPRQSDFATGELEGAPLRPSISSGRRQSRQL